MARCGFNKNLTILHFNIVEIVFDNIYDCIGKIYMFREYLFITIPASQYVRREDIFY